MRVAFFSTLEKLAQENKDIFIFTGDLGYKLFDSFKSKFPDRFFNIGIAESNMVGVSAGMSLCGKNVYCYSITPFLTMRAFEQVRIDVAYQNLNVKLVGVGGGVAYGLEGITHFGLEDLALMRSIKNMSVVCPADSFEAEIFAGISAEFPGPLYIRLGQNNDPLIHTKKPNLEFGKALVLSEGTDFAVYSIGSMLYVAKQAVEKLRKQGFNGTLINMHTLKPLDTDNIKKVASTCQLIFSLEEHNINGGLGSAIAETLTENNYQGHFKRIGIEETPHNFIGKADYLRKKHGLSAKNVYNVITGYLNRIALES